MRMSWFQLPLQALKKRKLWQLCGWGSISITLWFLRSLSGPVRYFVIDSNSSSASRSGHTQTGSLSCPVAGQSLSVMAEEGEMSDCYPIKCNKEEMRPRSCMLEPRSVRGHAVRQVVGM